MHDATSQPKRMLYSYEARCRAVDEMLAGVSPRDAAASVGASRASGYRWWARYRAGGWAALRERPSTPKRQPRRLSPTEEAEIVAARERSGAGPLTLGAMLGRPASTVGKVLRRLGRSRLPREPPPPVVRYERERPGELLHIDTKKLGRFWNVGKRILNDGVPRSPRAGWQHVHVAVDDHSRLAYAEVLPTDRRPRRPRVPRADAALVRRAGRHGRSGHDGQWARVHFARLAGALRRAGATPPADATLHAAHQRQGGALHPDAAALAGVRLRLPVQCTPRESPCRVAEVVQQTPSPRLARRPPAHQPCLTPPWSVQLAVPAEVLQ